MNKLFFYDRKKASSSICRALIAGTRAKRISWVSCKDFIEFLEIQGMAFDDIRWFHAYLMHIQKVRFFPNFAGSFFSFYDDRLFCISQSEFSREYRMDFTSSFGASKAVEVVWRRVVESQSSLLKLHSNIQIIDNEGANEECQELLCATGCIHA